MRNIEENYNANKKILKENLNRGMSSAYANAIINDMEQQFQTMGVYDYGAKQFIKDMRSILAEHKLGIRIVNN